MSYKKGMVTEAVTGKVEIKGLSNRSLDEIKLAFMGVTGKVKPLCQLQEHVKELRSTGCELSFVKVDNDVLHYIIG